MIIFIICIVFQSTLPRRERPNSTTLSKSFFDFNPRSREGSDIILIIPVHLLNDFNPRSREGSDCLVHNKLHLYSYFNPRSREGSDFIAYAIRHSQMQFQSTLPRRERQHFSGSVPLWTSISIHAPAKGATVSTIGRSQTGTKFQSTLPRRERRRKRMYPLPI